MRGMIARPRLTLATAWTVTVAGLLFAIPPSSSAFHSPPALPPAFLRDLSQNACVPPAESLLRLRGEGLKHGRLNLRGGGAGLRVGVMSGGGAEVGGVQKFYSFEGLIGAGKTTLLRKLEERGVAIIPEPLDRWEKSGIFKAFYGNMTRWSFTFQMSAYITRVKSVEESMASRAETSRFIGERSWCSDAYVFEPLLYRDGHISDMEHQAYQEWWRYLTAKAPETHGVIYLRASPETCHRRIMKRQRSEEAGIPLLP
ncbi:P-loop containing nucleoside triphosphate hydrolase protein [Baffinella frigidus]|nr:P-loop containing nucleoside triphosphate hydrolase protein [Cryptophyta sp. CCMP2293]